MNIRNAKREDIPLILSLIKELAEYEKMLDEVEATEKRLEEWIFNKKSAEVLIGEIDREAVGFALFFTNFSTFVGKAGLYLEDIYIKPKYRGNGYGKRFLEKLCEIAKDREYGRMDWVCLDWNAPSIKFYKSLGAQPLNEWTIYRLTEDKINDINKKGEE